MRGRAIALRGIGRLAGIGLGVGDEVFERGLRQVRPRGDDVGHQRQHADRHELGPVVGQRLVEVVVDRQGAGRAAQQGVAVGLGAPDDLGADIAARAGAVIDDHRLSPGGGELLADQAAQNVGRAAGREGHDDAHLLGWPSLGKGGCGQQQQCGDGTQQKHHRRHPPLCDSLGWLVFPAMLPHLRGNHMSGPFHAFAQSIQRQSPLRAAITAAWRRPEPECVPPLIEQASLTPARTAARPRAGDAAGRGAS